MSRLALTDDTTGLRAYVEFDRWDEGRSQWRWYLGVDDCYARGDDLRLGAVDDQTYGAALRALLDFFGAYAEAIEYERRTGRESDNGDMFPDALRPVAEAIGADSLALIARDAIRIPDDDQDA